MESFSILSVIIDKTKIIQIAGPFLAIIAIKSNPKKISYKLCCRLLFIIGRSNLCLGETALGKSPFGWSNHNSIQVTVITTVTLYFWETQISCVDLALMVNTLIKIDAIVNWLVLFFSISYRGISQILIAMIIMEWWLDLINSQHASSVIIPFSYPPAYVDKRQIPLWKSHGVNCENKTY